MNLVALDHITIHSYFDMEWLKFWHHCCEWIRNVSQNFLTALLFSWLSEQFSPTIVLPKQCFLLPTWHFRVTNTRAVTLFPVNEKEDCPLNYTQRGIIYRCWKFHLSIMNSTKDITRQSLRVSFAPHYIYQFLPWQGTGFLLVHGQFHRSATSVTGFAWILWDKYSGYYEVNQKLSFLTMWA